MHRQQLFKHIALLIILICVLNFLATKLHWYSLIWYFDMFMHFLGGFWLGIVFVYIFSVNESFEVLKNKISMKFIFKVILCVFLIGVGWELFEIIFYNYLAQNLFNILDTISDICFDLIGGVSAIIYVFFYFKYTTSILDNKV